MKNHEQIRRLLREYERSGFTQRHFAEQAEVAYSTFTHWLRRSRAGDFSDPDEDWIEAALPPTAAAKATATEGFLLELPAGLRLHMPADIAPAEVARLLQGLLPSCSR